ncbi:triose-phosphate isomerase [Pleomorphomonas carboxyditropha]|uniref:Triosephosphate isomerase n=1 Tax=Pleomorphomonas carboxyditropha TaxID=2023338 RepID=A0A2G9WUE4_9HYPH|nr:triose-phosphate isomerase [Pleomorphomonas carboxyditropha]PIO97942.1 triose-phosphate isomerase [Pleomorphomonas carboxyditropha]
MSTFWIGTGWKMNKTVAETRRYIADLKARLPDEAGADCALFIIPPFTALAAAREAIGAAPVLLGAQNMHWAEAGAYTGEISASMLEEFRIDLVELGHSERREYFGETDATINLKVKAALRHGLRPLVCVGDSAEERAAGASAAAVVRQVRLAFAGLTRAEIGRSLVAYEPVWAIGESGMPATPDEAGAVHVALHDALKELGAPSVPVLYGGSVNLENAAALAAEPAIDGLFVGRAAWSAEGLVSLVSRAMAARKRLRPVPTEAITAG